MIRVQGRGPVAMVFALLALRQGVRAGELLIDAVQAVVPPALAGRTLALGHGAWQLLTRVIEPPQATAIEAVEVSLAGRAGRTRILAREMGVPALGHVVRYESLFARLSEAVRAAGITQADPDADVPAWLTVHAEGNTGEDARVRRFGQSALLADCECARLAPAPPGSPGGRTAFERFTSEGPLAMLPNGPGDRYSVVWCAGDAASQTRAQLDVAAFEQALHEALGAAWGRPRLQGDRSLVALSRRARAATVTRQEVWIGNAAQALHPVAGQGLNLGVRDAHHLATLVGGAIADRTSNRIDVETLLARYRRARQLDRSAMITLTDLMAEVFTVAPLHPLQSLVLATLDLVSPARALLAGRLMAGFR